MVVLENRAGDLYANGVKVVRYLSPYQENGRVVQGYKLRRKLAGKQVLNACFLDALLPSLLIPGDRKEPVDALLPSSLIPDNRKELADALLRSSLIQSLLIQSSFTQSSLIRMSGN